MVHMRNAKRVFSVNITSFHCMLLMALLLLQVTYVFRTTALFRHYHEQNSSTEASNHNEEDSLHGDAWKPNKPVCSLQQTKEAPIPVILISQGRSGSSSTWQVMSNLTGYATAAIEWPGSDTKAMMNFFNNEIPKKWDNGNWILAFMCTVQKKHPKAGIIGFKWKPYMHTSFNQEYMNSLRFLAYSQNIKVVRLRRNLLDVTISRYKHKLFDASAHCAKDDIDCINQHLGNKVFLPTKKLVTQLRRSAKDEDEVDRLLEELGVPHVNVSYEKLYHGNNTEEWIRMFKFLRVGPMEGLTHNEVLSAQEHAATHSTSHAVTLQNYEEVRSTLVGTEFEVLLH